MVPIIRELQPTSRCMLYLRTCSQGQQQSLFPALPTFAGRSVSPALLQQTGLWLAMPEVIKVSCSVSGETLSVAVHRQVRATFIQCEKGTGVLNNQPVAIFLRLHGQLSPPAKMTWSRQEEPAWLGMANPGPLKFGLIYLL